MDFFARTCNHSAPENSTQEILTEPDDMKKHMNFGRKSREEGGTIFTPRRKQNNESLLPQEQGVLALVNSRSQDTDDDNTLPGLTQLFSTRRPKDLLGGISSGAKNVAKGVGIGAAALLAAPVAGAMTEGAGGFFKGLAAGVVMALVMPVAGIATGAYQLGRGMVYTPEAINESRRGRKWDRKKREWRDNWYALDEEREEVKAADVLMEQKRNAAKESDSSALSSGFPFSSRDKKVKETAFYDLLQVSPDATQAEIRKSYYTLARECHPDKHKNDPDAQKKFQALGEAYQVLGDVDRRKKYDENGKEAAQSMDIIDSPLFFTMLFGSEKMEPYVGRLQMAIFVDLFEGTNTSGKITEAVMEHEQRKREVELAVLLRERLDPYINAMEADRRVWEEKLRAEAKELCSNSFGDAMVEAVGWMYANYAEQYLGRATIMGVSRHLAKMKQRGRLWGTYYRTASCAIRVSLAAHKLNRETKVTTSSSDAETSSAADDTTASRLRTGNENPPDAEDRSKTSASNRPSGTTMEDSGSAARSQQAKSEQVRPQFGAEPNSRYTATCNSDNSKKPGSATSQPASYGSNKPTTPAEQSGSQDGEPKVLEDDEARQADTMPLILNTMLQICLLDIESTVRQAAKKVLKDQGVEPHVRTERAKALQQLGKVFMEAAEAHKAEMVNQPVDVMQQMQDAFIKAAQKADEEARKNEENPPASTTANVPNYSTPPKRNRQTSS